MSNATEYLADTDPRDASSALFLVLERLAEGVVKLSFRPVPGKNYRVESTPSLAAPDWQPVLGEDTGEGGVFELTLPISNGVEATYYRVRLMP